MAASPPKDTIYIDIDDEITGIIDKMHASDGKVVALVLPKRASVLQSIVNMRLLKRAADEAKKHVVLITAEVGLLPLAGAAGVHVAKTLTSKPEIPTPPTADDEEETVDEDESGHKYDPEITAASAGAVAVGALAGLPPKDGVETLELDDDETPESTVDDAPKAKASVPALGKKNTKLAVPDFDRFRLLLIGGGLLLVLLIVGFVFAENVLPKATITIKTDASNVNVSANLALSTTATALDPKTITIPAKLLSQPKTYTQQATATGQKNNGTKAAGTVNMSAQACAPHLGQPDSVPAGTGISTSGLTYITQGTTKFSAFGHGSGSCLTYDALSATDISSQGAGAKYNVSSASFTVAGRSDASGTGSASGGTDSIIQVVSQGDIDGAKSKIATDDATVKQALQTQLSQAGYYSIVATFSAGTPAVTTSANAGDAASSVTVTEIVTYTMFGVHQADLKTIVDNNVKTQIDTAKQSILSQGLSAATFSVTSTTATGAQVTLQTTAEVGPQLDVATIKTQTAGKKTGDVQSLLQSNPDVTSVTVKYSPFWVTSVPKHTNNITVNIAKPTTTASKNPNAANP